MTASASSLGESIEILNPDIPRGQIRHALFDFDGTLSLIREGWQDIMVPMLLECLVATGTDEDEATLRHIVMDWVTRLTGKQTIYQMIELAEQVSKRGGAPLDPLEYKREYLRRLDERIHQRIDGLANGSIEPASLLLPGSMELLDALRNRGVSLYLASGTDEEYVIREARLLGIADYFDGGIWGAKDNYHSFSKAMVIESIIQENRLVGPELLGIGDGYVEIENTKEVGGIALGVPCLESQPVQFDLWKKERLKLAGADMLIPNFLEHTTVLGYLFDDA